MDGRLTRTNCDEAGDYVVPNVLSPRDLVSRPDNMDKNCSIIIRVLHLLCVAQCNKSNRPKTCVITALCLRPINCVITAICL